MNISCLWHLRKIVYLLCVAFCVLGFVPALGMQTGEAPIFACLSREVGPDFTCLNREILLNQHWQHEKNSRNETPLLVALRMKHLPLAMFFLKYGATVKKVHVVRAMKYFHNIDGGIYGRISRSNLWYGAQKKSSSEDLIRAALADPDPEGSLAKLVPVLHFFSENEDLALDIYDLFHEGLLKERHAQILLADCYDLFLQDGPISSEQVAAIVAILMPLQQHRLLLRFIMDAATRMPVESPRQVQCLPKGEAKKIPMVQEVAHAIIENSRTMFLTFSPSLLVRDAKTKGGTKEVNAAHESLRRLSKFVGWSIISAGENECDRRYLFWVAVYETLIAEGDFLSGYYIGFNLSKTKIQKKVNAKVYREVINIQDNFRSYRQAVELLEQRARFYIPSLQVTKRDLTAMLEKPLLVDGKLNKEQIELFISLQRRITMARHKAMGRSYKTQAIFGGFFNPWPPRDKSHQMDQKDCVQLLWPASPPARRRSNTFSFESFVVR